MKLRTLTIRGLPEPLLKVLRAAAKRSRRSLNAEVLVRLEVGAAAIAVESTAVGRPARADSGAPAGPAAPTARVAEPVGQSYEVRRAFDEANLSRLRSDLALTPEQRVHLGEELARVSAAQRPRPRFQRVIQFDRYEDYLDWKRYGDRAP
jgi:plasmid stability protein